MWLHLPNPGQFKVGSGQVPGQKPSVVADGVAVQDQLLEVLSAREEIDVHVFTYMYIHRYVYTNIMHTSSWSVPNLRVYMYIHLHTYLHACMHTYRQADNRHTYIVIPACIHTLGSEAPSVSGPR